MVDIQILPIKIESIFDISLIVAFISAIAFYFGKIINEILPQKESPYANYVQGFLFIVLYILLPVLIFYAVQEPIQQVGILITFFVQIAVLIILILRFGAFQIERLELRGYVDKKISEGSAALAQKMPVPADTDTPLSKNAVQLLLFSRLHDVLLLVLSVITINGAIRITISQEPPVLIFISGLMAFSSVSLIAILFGWNRVRKYPRIAIHLINGKTKTGQLTKIGENYVSIISKAKIIHIPENQITLMELDKLKKGKTS